MVEDIDNLREELADLCHKQWSGWMRYLFSECDASMPTILTTLSSGSLIIPVKSVARWKRQMNTPYSDLSELEKESNRKEADEFIKLLSSLKSVDIKQKEIEKKED